MNCVAMFGYLQTMRCCCECGEKEERKTLWSLESHYGEHNASCL